VNYSRGLEIKGVNFAEITLHVGLGNFRTVDVEDLTKHKMDSERIIVTEEATNIVNEAKEKRKKYVLWEQPYYERWKAQYQQRDC
jgi:S-adenosylmethionine:tRNA-ribosyltransferase-isomerase (queuine synthetase)